MNNFKYPVYKPSLNGKEKEYVLDCIESTWISSKGKYIAKFEDSFAKYIDVPFATTVSNGTVALHLALLTLGVGVGDEVIVPTLTYIASVNAISYTGATPVFVDSYHESWQMDVADVQKKIGPKTKAIMAVHLYGQSCDMEGLSTLAKENGIFLVEDCAEAIGTRFKDKHVGTFGDISTFSFFGNKTITTGEGGMVVTNDPTLYDRALHFKGQGLAKYREYWHDVIGYNYRMTNICAAIGLAQIERIESILKKKKEIAEWYVKHLENTEYTFQSDNLNTLNSHWICSVLTPKFTERDHIREFLKEQGIETRPVFYPVHTMPMYSTKYETHRVAEDIARRGISLPSYPELEESDVLFICDMIKEYSSKN